MDGGLRICLSESRPGRLPRKRKRVIEHGIPFMVMRRQVIDRNESSATGLGPAPKPANLRYVGTKDSLHGSERISTVEVVVAAVVCFYMAQKHKAGEFHRGLFRGFSKEAVDCGLARVDVPTGDRRAAIRDVADEYRVLKKAKAVRAR